MLLKALCEEKWAGTRFGGKGGERETKRGRGAAVEAGLRRMHEERRAGGPKPLARVAIITGRRF